MKKHITIAGIIFLAGVLALPMMTFAQNGRNAKRTDRMMGMEMSSHQGGLRVGKTTTLTDEQKGQIEDLLTKFRSDNADTLKELMTKRFDLKTALESDPPDGAKAKAIQKDISELTGKLAQEKIDLFIEIHKINPDAKFNVGMGMGSGIKRM